MSNTFIYVRVSQNHQTTDNQLYAMRDTAYGKHSDGVFDDTGVSGSVPAMERPQFSEMMSQLQSGDTVVAYSISRLGRSASDTLQVIEQFKGMKVSLISHTEGFDVTKPIGKLVVTILAGVAEMEREVMIERINAGIARAKSEGVHCGRVSTDKGVEARRMLSEGVTVKDVIAQTGMSKSMVYRLKSQL